MDLEPGYTHETYICCRNKWALYIEALPRIAIKEFKIESRAQFYFFRVPVIVSVSFSL